MKVFQVRLILLGEFKMTFKKKSRSLFSRQHLRNSRVGLHIFKTINLKIELMGK